MAHFAEIDADNIVLRVLVVDDDDIADARFASGESEQKGKDFLEALLPGSGPWVQTSYNTHGNVHHGSDWEPDGGTPLHMNYAGIGYTWDGTGFVLPQPYGSWTLDENYVWQPPTPEPSEDGYAHYWD